MSNRRNANPVKVESTSPRNHLAVLGKDYDVDSKQSGVKEVAQSIEVPQTQESTVLEQETPLHIDTSFDLVSEKQDLLLPHPKQTNVSKYSPIGSRRDKPKYVSSDANASNGSQEDDISIDSVSASSEESKQDSNMLRPPPGLAPPPGFASSDMLHLPLSEDRLSPDKLIPPIPEVSDLPLSYDGGLLSNLLVNQDEVQLSSNNIQDDARYSHFDHDENTILPVLAQETPTFMQKTDGEEDTHLLRWGQEEAYDRSDGSDDMLLLGLGQDFNVMDFLSFLDEGVQEEAAQTEDESIGENDLYNSNMHGSNHPKILLNPWGGSGKPRALAYGIEVEPENNKDGLNGDGDLQLLTPSMILGQNLLSTEKEEIENATVLNLDQYLEEKDVKRE